MKHSSARAWCQLFLLAMLLFGSLHAASTSAQGPLPPAPAEPAPSPQIANDADYNAEIVTAPPADQAKDETSTAPEAVEPVDQSFPAITSEPQAAPITGASVPAVQGDVKLDVSTPDEIRAGAAITYTYAYTNTGSTTATAIKIKTTWTRFKLTNAGGLDQFCEPIKPGENPCDVLPGSVSGPPVQMTTTAAEYSVGDLAPGQSGRFSIQLRTRTDMYPQAGRALVRPAGSGQLFVNNSSAVMSDDTATSLIAGPVLIVNKRVAAPDDLLPNETGTFIITLSNATDHRAGAPVRADARRATNVVLIDTFPNGSEFISATGNPVVDLEKKTLTWRVASLDPDQATDFSVTYRKLNVADECRKLNNKTMTATSDEYPLKTTERYVVAGRSAAFDVLDPMLISSVTAVPSTAVFGTDSILTIAVKNYWGQAVDGAQLSYSVQTNANYVPGSATPAPTSVDANGTIIWTFSMPAGTKTVPSLATFSVRLQAGYTTTAQRGTVQIIAPSNVPSACLQLKNARIGLKPRLEVTKSTPADPSTKIGNLYQVERGQPFDYTITVANIGSSAATEVEIQDLLPDERGAAFKYIVDSSFVDGQKRDPDDVDPGGTYIRWTGLVVAPGTTLEIKYKLLIDGFQYANYCNRVTGTNGEEKVTIRGASVCVKINPQVEMSKTVDKAPPATVELGEEVRFTLSLTNRESTVYPLGLFDALGEFEFVRQESGYATPFETTRQGIRGLEWPLQDLQPGQTIGATIVARVPNVCKTRDYVNEAMFHNRENNLIRMIPTVTARVHVICGQLDYSKSVDGTKASLGDRVMFTLSVKNSGANLETNILVEDVMENGLTFDGMAADSQIKTAPAQSNQGGDTRLTWTLPSLASLASTRIIYYARTGNVVDQYTNKLSVIGGRCSGSCASDGSYSFQNVNVEPLITLEPQIVETECAQPGDARTYRLSIVNTNDHEYNNIQVSVKLPFGLTYARALGRTQAPRVEQTADGGSQMVWSEQHIGRGVAQIDYEVELMVGQVFGNLDAVVTTTSPDGTIPRKDGVLDPTVAVCAGDPAIFMDANRRLILPGEELIYGITLVNPSPDEITASIEDVLPAAFSFVANVQGTAPIRSGNILTWNNLKVPAATEAGPGKVLLRFRVREIAGAVDVSYANTVKVIESTPTALDTTYDTVTVLVVKDILTVYLPLIRR